MTVWYTRPRVCARPGRDGMIVSGAEEPVPQGRLKRGTK